MKPLEYKTQHHPITSSTLCKKPHLNNKQNKNTNLIISRQDYHLTQPSSSEENKQANKQKLSTNLTLYKAYTNHWTNLRFSSFQSLSCVRLFVAPWITAHEASLSNINSRSSLRLMSIKSVMPSSHLMLCHPLFLLPPIPPSTRVFSNESTLRMRWPKYRSFSFSIIPS